jgi:hypothetical protein
MEHWTNKKQEFNSWKSIGSKDGRKECNLDESSNNYYFWDMFSFYLDGKWQMREPISGSSEKYSIILIKVFEFYRVN